MHTLKLAARKTAKAKPGTETVQPIELGQGLQSRATLSRCHLDESACFPADDRDSNQVEAQDSSQKSFAEPGEVHTMARAAIANPNLGWICHSLRDQGRGDTS